MFTLPTTAAAFSMPSVPSGVLPSFDAFGRNVAVLDDVKSKAQRGCSELTLDFIHCTEKCSLLPCCATPFPTSELESSAKKEFSKAEDKVLSKVPESAGGNKIELYSGRYYATCALGGAVACGATHTFVTPLDLVKCRRQVDKNLYAGNMDGWKKIVAADGVKGLYTGWGPTAIGYSMQGAAKYGFYEYFKKTYSDMAGPTNAKKYKDAIFLAGSASAEFLADMALVPMEAVKVRIQTTMPPFASGAIAGLQKFTATEGTGALFKSLPSLWSRQIPYTMMKFWSFEATVAKIYSYLGKPAASYNKLQQLGVSALAGYIAGVFCAVVSHPADTMVSKLNAQGKAGAAKPTVGSIYSEIGFGGLWAGLSTRIIMIGTLTALQWLIYDSFKVYAGLPTTGAAPPAEKTGPITSKIQ